MTVQDIRLPGRGPPERDNEPTSAARARRARERKDTGERLSKAFENYRQVHNTIRAAIPPPKPSWLSSLAGFVLTSVSKVPTEFVQSTIADLGRELLDRKQQADDTGEPEAFLPD